MKNLLILVAATMSLALAGCSKDEVPGVPQPEDIVGTWAYVGRMEYGRAVYDFKKVYLILEFRRPPDSMYETMYYRSSKKDVSAQFDLLTKCLYDFHPDNYNAYKGFYYEDYSSASSPGKINVRLYNGREGELIFLSNDRIYITKVGIFARIREPSP